MYSVQTMQPITICEAGDVTNSISRATHVICFANEIVWQGVYVGFLLNLLIKKVRRTRGSPTRF